MALGTVYSDVATLQLDPSSRNASSRLKATNVGAGLKIVKASYAIDASELAADDIINVCELPKGARVIPELSSIYIPDSSSGSGTLVVDVGDNDTTPDQDRYSDGLTLSAGGFFAFTAGGTVASASTSTYLVEGNNTYLQVKIITATSIDTDVTAQFTVVYTVE